MVISFDLILSALGGLITEKCQIIFIFKDCSASPWAVTGEAGRLARPKVAKHCQGQPYIGYRYTGFSE
jgi:hypothetical protein